VIAFGIHNINIIIMYVVWPAAVGVVPRSIYCDDQFHENDRKECKSPAAVANGRPDARGCARPVHRPIDLRYSACRVMIMYIIYYYNIQIRITVPIVLFVFFYGCRKCALRMNVCVFRSRPSCILYTSMINIKYNI